MTITNSTGSLRLVIITASFHPAIGGAETYAYEIAQTLAASGHNITIITDLPRGCKSDYSTSIDPINVTVNRLSKYQRLLDDESKIPWEQMIFGLLPEIDEIVAQINPNIVLSNSLDTGYLAKIIQLDRNIPWAATFHEQSPEIEPLGIGRLKLIYEVLQPDLVLAGSEFYANRAKRWGYADRVELIYHGVDTEKFHPSVDKYLVRQKYKILPSEILIVCAGRLKQRKGMKELIYAFSRVVQNRPYIRLLIVGSVNSASRAYADQLKIDAEKLGVKDKVIFDETVNFQDMPSVLAAADIVAQPSLEEGLGLSVIEAMASGKPIITTDIPGIREITTTPNVAIVVNPGEITSLADALVQLIDDKDLRESLGIMGRQHAELNFSRLRMVQQTEAALIKLLQQKGENTSL